MKLYPATAIILSMLLLGGLSNAATADTPLAGADGSAAPESIQVDGKVAVIEGIDHFVGAPIQACDLRAGAALVIAALAAHGTTEVSCVQYIERGYEDLVGKLRSVGADIRVEEIPGDESEIEAHIG